MPRGRIANAVTPLLVLAVAGFAGALGGCAGLGSGDVGPSLSERADVEPRDTPDRREIEESDIYRLDGDLLYVLNARTGLNIVDVSNPRAPEMAGRLLIGGNAGELYVRDSRVFVIFDELAAPCTLSDELRVGPTSGNSELVAIENSPDDPTVAGLYCMPGVVVASRMVGDVLYVVANEAGYGGWTQSWQTWLFAYDVSNPRRVTLADFLAVEGQCEEVHVTSTAVYMTQPTQGVVGTTVRYVDISDPDGTMVQRGDISVSGAPMGRFHMDADGDLFRIVTYHASTQSSDLHVIDTSDPDSMEVVGALTDIAPGETLHATYFVGEKVYIVTYLPPPPDWGWGEGCNWWEASWMCFGDPLWTISLEDPTAPEILGELQLPGWSDFVFPIGDRLIGVGRGELGEGVGAALFDVSDPRDPLLLQRLEFGQPDASSEANTDFRGVRIVEPGRLSEHGLLVVPFDDRYVGPNGCTEDAFFLQLIDVEPTDLVLRGRVELAASGRRAIPLGDRLLAIDDQEVTSIDVADTTQPIAASSVTVGDGLVAGNLCLAFGNVAGCNASGASVRGSGGSAAIVAAAAGLLLFALALRRARV